VGAIIAVSSLAVRRPADRLPTTAIAAVALALANLLYGAIAIQAVNSRMEAAPTFRLALVQVDPESDDATDTLRRLTREVGAAARPPDLVVWPECSGGSYEEGLDAFSDEAIVFRRSREPKRGLRPLPEPACPLLLGGRVYRGYRERPDALFQAALLIDTDERLAGSSLKRHLMPFGEYVPWADVVPELRLSFPMEASFSVGGEPSVIRCGQARIGPLLCYEDMVPSAAASLVEMSANLLVSLIHDAAFTNPLTLRQHRLLAQSRAIENRRTLVRCGSTGETCVIDAAGRIRARLPLDAEDVLVADVPLLESQSLAGILGPVFPITCGLAVIVIAIGRLRKMAGLAERPAA
jgi:apolipoprotein N-acyltransferase